MLFSFLARSAGGRRERTKTTTANRTTIKRKRKRRLVLRPLKATTRMYIDDLYNPPAGAADGDDAEIFRQIGVIFYNLGFNHPAPRWRAIWAIEEKHESYGTPPLMFGVRRRNFNRWPREKVEAGDLYRDGDPNTGAIYFPGKDASHDAKAAWAGMVVEEALGNNMMPSFDRRWERDSDMPTLDEVGDYISDILLACAPNTLSVCIYMERRMIDCFLSLAEVGDEIELPFEYSSSMTKEQEEANNRALEARGQNAGLEEITKFLSSPYLRNDTPGQLTLTADEVDRVDEAAIATRLSNFKHWLTAEAAVGGSLHQEATIAKLPPRRHCELSIPSTRRDARDNDTVNDIVLLARRDGVAKDADTKDVVDEMLTSLGIRHDIVSTDPANSRNPDIPGCTYATRERVGGNIHHPDDGGRTSVSLLWSRTEKLTEKRNQTRQYERAFKTDFVVHAKAKMEASEGRLQCIFWPRDVAEETGYYPLDITAVTCENSHVIWLPGAYYDIEQEVSDQLAEGGGAGGIRFISTRHGNMFWDLVFDFWEKKIVRDSTKMMLRRHDNIPNRFSLRMCLLIALAHTLVQADACLIDHERSAGDIQRFFDKMKRAWRAVLAHSDEVLRLGLLGSDCTNARVDSPGASREGLDAMMQHYALRLENLMGDLEITVRF